MDLWSFKRVRSLQLLSGVLPLVLLSVGVPFAGAIIGTESPIILIDVHSTDHLNSAPRIESSTSIPNLIPTMTSVDCHPASVLVNETTTCTANVDDSTPAGSLLSPTGNVTFNEMGVASGVSFEGNPCTLGKSETAGTSTCTITLNSTRTGTASITATYRGDLDHGASTSAAVPLSVGGFTVSTSSATLTLFEGTPASITITVYSLNGFSGTVELSASCTSHDVKVALTSPNETLGPGQHESLTLSAYAPSSAIRGNYTITVIGTDASLSERSTIVVTLLLVPRLSAPLFVTATPGSLLTFKVNASDTDATRILLLTADPSSLPNGAYFTSVTGNGTLTGIFDWALSQKTRPGNYTMIFRVSDDRGGSSTAQVVVDVLSVNRSSTLPLTSSLRYVVIAALGVALIVFGDRLWRAKKARPSSTDTPAGPDSGLQQYSSCTKGLTESGGSDGLLNDVPEFTMLR